MTDPVWRIEQGHVLEVLRAMEPESVQVCVTSPPYWGLRAYKTESQIWGGDHDCAHEWGPACNVGAWHDGNEYHDCRLCGAWRGELGSEPTIECYVEHIVAVFREVRRVLRNDGTCWLNIGDSYAGSGKGPTGHNGLGDQEERQGFTGVSGKSTLKFGGKSYKDYTEEERAHLQASQPVFGGGKSSPGMKAKDLCLIPERLALALQADGWWVRSRIAWCKRAPMPESVTDRPTSAWEHIWLLSKSARYYYDADAVREDAIEGTDIGLLRGRSFDSPEFVSAHAPSIQKRIEFGVDSRTAGTGTRNMWNYWTLSPEPWPQAHFATFPTEIPRRAILAGSSERGCCPQCGTPWKRVVERIGVGRSEIGEKTEAKRADGLVTQFTRAPGGAPSPEITTLGWEPGCKCNAGEPVPCVVLDPFAGSGTTVMVALRHNRRAVGIELNPEYVRMARGRIVGDAPLFNWQDE